MGSGMGKATILLKVALVLTAVAACFALLGGGISARAQTAVDVGYRDFSFAGTGSPTGEKPQSKLWFNDGSWWGVLWDPVSDDFHIHRFNWQNNSWSDTGTLIDGRHNAKADALWDGTHLYVVTAPDTTSTSDQNAYVRRYSYGTATKGYSLDSGFPVKVASGRVEAVVLDKDSTGKLWVTYTQGNKVYVNASQGSDSSWGAPFVPQVKKGASNLTSDDISSVVAFDRKTAAPQVGLMWSNQIDDAVYFATHKDGDPVAVWQASRTAVAGPGNADDHISLKSVQVDDSTGRVFAAMKTSLSNTSQPLIFLSVLGQDGSWTSHVFGRVADDHTRPIVVIDEENRILHMFATAPISPGGTIYHKQTPLDNISFEDQVGVGTPFIKSSTDTTINNATSTKQSVNSKTDLLVLAGDDGTGYYLHNLMDIPAGVGSPEAPDTTIDSGPTGSIVSASASFTFSASEQGSTFECKLDGGPYGGCASPKDYAGLADGTHTFYVRAKDVDGNVDPTPASRSWAVDATAPTVGSVSPADGATNVALTSVVEATFSEAMDPSTLSADTFTLTKQGSTQPVAATVSYDSATKKATLDPSGNLETGATYMAAIKGGSSGAKDTVGNALASERTWSFTTTASADLTPPAVQPPAEHFLVNTSAGGTNIPVNLNWLAVDSESAIAEYQLQQSSNGGTTFSAVTLSSITSTSTVIHLVPGKTYQYRVRAKDVVGNESDWAYGPKFVVSPFQETNSAIAYAGIWTQQSATSAYGGASKYALDAGAEATFTFSGREVAWLAAKAPDRGRAEVWLDGVKVADVDLYNKTAQWRKMVFAAGSLDASGTHTLTVKTSGTGGRPRVDVDAFFTIQ